MDKIKYNRKEKYMKQCETCPVRDLCVQAITNKPCPVSR